jgi:hypothetical protein
MKLPTLLLLSPLLAVAACPVPPDARLLLGVDVSDSIPKTDRADWLNTADQFISCLGKGSRIEIFLVDANTRNEAPIFNAEVPSQTSKTVKGARDYIKARAAFRQRLTDALDKAFRGDLKSPKTDVFGLLDRAASDAPTAMVLFSDAYATEDINLERVPITPDKVPSMINSLAALHHWSGTTLRGEDIWVILPSSGRIGPNDRVALRGLYEQLFHALGSNSLKRFDTHL